jgi:glycosyltransferase involved in cell wall biosynthesis
VSNNYLHYANTLFDSVKEFCPEADLFLGLCDKSVNETSCPGAEIIELADLPIENLGRFIYQYSILELNTAIKPYVIEQLMNKGYDKVIYIDPDIKIFGSLDGMLSLLDQHNILLTPHLTNLLDDGKLPNELGILQAGSYNLGYIGLRTCEETRKLVKWWQAKLYKECVVDLSRGLFVDQKWMDMVPSLFEGVYINRDEGWNVAYWNLNHRNIKEISTNKFEVNGRPLVFFHYSGYSIESKTLSKHQNRFSKKSKGSALVKLCSIYNSCLLKNKIDEFKTIPYFYRDFFGGVLVPDAARLLIKDDEDFSGLNFLSGDDLTKIYSRLNERSSRAKNSQVLISRLAESVWRSRVDLQSEFPDLYDSDAVRFSEWLLSAGEDECGLDSVFLDPILESLTFYRAHIFSESKEGDAIFSSTLMSYLWSKKHIIPLPVKKLLGSTVRKAILNRAYPKASGANLKNLGVNLIGYMQAESGVGEAARSSLRGLKASTLPHAIMDYRLGNISRMDESENEYADKPKYSINLIHVNADQTKIAKEHIGLDVFDGRYNIGYWYWELPEFPDFYDFAFNEVDEIWVSTQFNLAAISQATNKPVRIIRPNVDVNIDVPMSRDELGLMGDSFIFLHMSDALSMPERKNPEGVIEAFNIAFGSRPDDKVALVVKISNLDKQPDLKSRIELMIADDPRITLLEGYLSRDVLNNLIDKTDCYVSLHRAEGFGLPIAEAMYLGKPVIATHWSGNTDFMSHDNSLPVSYELVKLEKDIGPYKKGQVWADPNIKDAAEKMLCISRDEELASEIGSKAKGFIKANYSPEVTGIEINKRLMDISSTR